MKLAGRRQSKNIDDIRKQKPQILDGWETDPSQVKSGFVRATRLAQEPSDKPSAKAKPAGAYKKIAKQVGKGQMADAAKRDAATIEKKNRDDLANEPLSPKWRVLDEVWTPKEIKMK